jgi:hypothetical protein
MLLDGTSTIMGQQDCPICSNIARKPFSTQAAFSRKFDIILLNSQFMRNKISESEFFSFRVKPCRFFKPNHGPK